MKKASKKAVKKIKGSESFLKLRKTIANDFSAKNLNKETEGGLSRMGIQVTENLKMLVTQKGMMQMAFALPLEAKNKKILDGLMWEVDTIIEDHKKVIREILSLLKTKFKADILGKKNVVGSGKTMEEAASVKELLGIK